MSRKENKENVVALFKELKGMLDELPESKLKQDFKRFLHIFMSGSASFRTILEVLDQNTKQDSQAVNMDTVNTPKTITSFWKKVRKLILETYKENR